MLSMALGTIFLVLLVAFVCEYVDSTLGMGYGTTLTPLLLLMGFAPLAVVPAVLVSELVTGGLAALLHHRAGNVRFDFRKDHNHRIVRQMGRLGYVPRSRDSKIALVLGVCSILGAVVAASLALSISAFYMKLFIGILVLTMGVIILLRHRSTPRFSWSRIGILGITAAFNKGLSGGGYGPLVTSGQILSGVHSRNSVAITSLAESFTCLVGVLTYLMLGEGIDWRLAPVLTVGAVFSAPLAAATVKRMRLSSFTLLIGTATAALGLLTLCKVLL